MSAQIINIPLEPFVIVHWCDTDGVEHVTRVMGTNLAHVARITVALENDDIFDEFLEVSGDELY